MVSLCSCCFSRMLAHTVAASYRLTLGFPCGVIKFFSLMSNGCLPVLLVEVVGEVIMFISSMRNSYLPVLLLEVVGEVMWFTVLPAWPRDSCFY